jgi:hypothetical protein
VPQSQPVWPKWSNHDLWSSEWSSFSPCSCCEPHQNFPSVTTKRFPSISALSLELHFYRLSLKWNLGQAIKMMEILHPIFLSLSLNSRYLDPNWQSLSSYWLMSHRCFPQNYTRNMKRKAKQIAIFCYYTRLSPQSLQSLRYQWPKYPYPHSIQISKFPCIAITL